MYKEIEGDLISLALNGEFDVIGHGCNCSCAMGAGIAPLMAKAFAVDTYLLEGQGYVGDINKLGQIGYGSFYTKEGEPVRAYSVEYVNNALISEGWKHNRAVNMYTQYQPGRSKASPYGVPLDYDALTLCLRKMNWIFRGEHIALPLIGCGLAGGDWSYVQPMIEYELSDCDITIVKLPETAQKPILQFVE